ncbi:hypothetical protein E2562_027038 [Oryza meyeriana var. granulata]|uniref:DUF3444 domain-containing protein n=1 Tax=Oryza meyeriana var. granulata TaxID=110450 RepID=A0A6G1CAP4_9ORYZ|nr:hypothetical protein E2562_027038 [Oryza meyeriana var. granulata]
MNWTSDWTPYSMDTCKFTIGEIVERMEASIKVSLLTQVNGYRAVFKPDKCRGVLVIPIRDRLRFSHRIPSFRLTEERGGKLRGFLELDPGSVPDVFLYREESNNDAFKELSSVDDRSQGHEDLPFKEKISFQKNSDSANSIDTCEFAIGEIVGHTKASIRISLLTQLSGFRAVFKPDKQSGVLEIPTRDRLRFSHQIPSFLLTEERGGKLRGFYELDPASVPDVFLYGNTVKGWITYQRRQHGMRGATGSQAPADVLERQGLAHPSATPTTFATSPTT